VWTELPVRPRAVVPARTAGYPFGFSLDGRALLDQDYGTMPRPPGFVGSGWVQNRPADGPVRLWDKQTGRCLGSWPLTDSPFAQLICAVAPDGRTAALGEVHPRHENPYWTDLVTGERVALPLRCHSASFTPDGRHLLLASAPGDPFQVVWWDCGTRRAVNTFPGLALVALAPDGRWVSAVGSDDDPPAEVCVREPVTGRELVRLRLPEPTFDITFSADGAYLFVATPGGVEIVDAATGRTCVRLPTPLGSTPGKPANILVPPGTGRVSVVTTGAGSAWLERWDLATGKSLGRQDISAAMPAGPVEIVVPAPAAGVFGVWVPNALSWLDGWMATIPIVKDYWQPSSGSIVFLDADTGRRRGRLPLRGSYPFVDMSRDGGTLLGIADDGRFEFWDIPPRKPLTGFAVAAGVGALPLAWLARRRARRLRMAV
jgi:WD40 repeat protein